MQELFERLHEDRARRENNQQAKTMAKEKQEIEKFTFSP